jgi:hypothetical protein
MITIVLVRPVTTWPTIRVHRGTFGPDTFAAMAIESDAVIVWEWPSVMVTTKLDVPDAVGVPLIDPAVDSVKPLGIFPDETCQVKVLVPPVPLNVCE